MDSITFKVACDVINPLFGQNGAAFVYGYQKGASEVEIEILDKGLQHISSVFADDFNLNVENIKGAGAAGGMGAGAIAFLNAELLPGIDLIKELVDFDEKIKGADWIITGEGKLDSQTLSGKTMQGVISSAKKQDISVVALCGSISLPLNQASNYGFFYMDSVLDKAKNIEDAMTNTSKYVKEIVNEFLNYL